MISSVFVCWMSSGGVLPCPQNCQRGEMLIDWSDKRTIKGQLQTLAPKQSNYKETECAGFLSEQDRYRLISLLQITVIMLLLLVVTVCGSSIGVESLPLPDSGPHLANDWGEAVRLRHLYAARHGLHLQINPDGEISGSYMQSSDSKWRACHAVTLISALHSMGQWQIRMSELIKRDNLVKYNLKHVSISEKWIFEMYLYVLNI